MFLSSKIAVTLPYHTRYYYYASTTIQVPGVNNGRPKREELEMMMLSINRWGNPAKVGRASRCAHPIIMVKKYLPYQENYCMTFCSVLCRSGLARDVRLARVRISQKPSFWSVHQDRMSPRIPEKIKMMIIHEAGGLEDVRSKSRFTMMYKNKRK